GSAQAERTFANSQRRFEPHLVKRYLMRKLATNTRTPSRLRDLEVPLCSRLSRITTEIRTARFTRSDSAAPSMSSMCFKRNQSTEQGLHLPTPLESARD